MGNRREKEVLNLESYNSYVEVFEMNRTAELPDKIGDEPEEGK